MSEADLQTHPLDQPLEGGDAWNQAIRATAYHELGTVFVVQAYGRWLAGVRNAANTLWLRRADAFTSDAKATEWACRQLADIAEHGL